MSSEAEEKARAASKEVLLPWSGIVCLIYSFLTSLVAVLSLLCCDVAPRWTKPDPEELSHSSTALFLIVSAVIVEVASLATSLLASRLLGRQITFHLPKHSGTDSVIVLLQYGTKFLCALYLWRSNGGLIHTDAQALGGDRPVYFARFAQWSVAVPLLVFTTNRAFLAEQPFGSQLARSAPGLICASVFVWASWVMEVTVSPFARWPLFFLSLFGFVLVCVDQLKLAYDHRRDGGLRLKLFMLGYEIVMMNNFGVVFCLGRFGIVSSLSEQKFYAYSDATVKLFLTVILTMVRNYEAFMAIGRFWTAADSANKDLGNLVRGAMLPVFALDLDGRITLWNGVLEKLTGLGFDDVKGKPLADVISPGRAEEVAKAIDHVTMQSLEARTPHGTVAPSNPFQANRSFMDVSIPYQSAEGEKKNLHLGMSFLPKQNEMGELAGIMAIGQDLSEITDLKLMQEKRAVLMGMLSHELRSPLHGINGLANALIESENAKPMKRQLGMIKGCSVRLLDLVTNIMEIAQNESAKERSQKMKEAPRMPDTPVNVAEIVDEVVTMTNLAVDKTNKPLVKELVKLESRVPDGLPFVPGEPHKLTQVLYNLLTNACKFTERGSVTLSARYLAEQERLEIDVTDTGRGISEKGLTRIFEPFSQETNGDKRDFQGIGLGLTVCSQIVALHGGEIEAKSQLGQGSTFTISLPCNGKLGITEPFQRVSEASPVKKPVAAPGRDAGQAREKSVTEGLFPRCADGSPPLVLSVDDNEVNQEVVKNALDGHCDVRIAMDGQEALDFVAKCRREKTKMPDVVLLDIQMPGLDGYQVCEQIRSEIESMHLNMAIIMVSAKAPANEAAVKGFEMGSSDFLAKPFCSKVLVNKVRVALQVKQDASIGGSTVILNGVASQRVCEATQSERDLSAQLKAMKRELEINQRRVEELQGQNQELERGLAGFQQGNTAEQQEREQIHNDQLSLERERSQWWQEQVEVLREREEVKAEKEGLLQQQVKQLMLDLEQRQQREQALQHQLATLEPQAPKASRYGADSQASTEGQMEQDIGEWGKPPSKRQPSDDRAVITVLSSRLHMVTSIGRGCQDLLGTFSVGDPEVMPLLNSQLELMVQVAVQSGKVALIGSDEGASHQGQQAKAVHQKDVPLPAFINGAIGG
mmetsp:Transcript_87074/g.188463  ORF Transcript_87074/g.188463 Transcript_87074/m.188463 type:complete len:1152 (+) Transcript_87074:95-3550(+)